MKTTLAKGKVIIIDTYKFFCFNEICKSLNIEIEHRGLSDNKTLIYFPIKPTVQTAFIIGCAYGAKTI